ncbi:uncharacterized protein YjlB [Novosphingobium sp. PhB165]|uniref:cupin n=1 Tax=Novosphingobium sp. PhB165 TaxID=2485105 RepID=UPI00104FCF20|nr:cupin [Novosphingobium sp. PhB165]TCM14027.1 uncharacterized protein YjlB [Novosphingobium sp. PhB165]
MTPEKFLLVVNGWMPNNQRLSVLIYRSVESGNRAQIAEAFEKRFAEHGWPPKWRETIFDYHHYHSTAHEGLGAASGRASVVWDGPGPMIVSIVAGDAFVLPVGTGHCLIESSEDFLVVGAYPQGQDWDICQDPPSKEALGGIQKMLAAEQDPVTGE